MSYDLGAVICQYRQGKKMTQEEFASRIGVTAQAVSKWERGNGLPDVSLIGGICSVLGISADVLLGIENRVVENGNPIEDADVKSNLIAEPIVMEFSETLIELFNEGINSSIVQECRKHLARENGLLLPILRFRDNVDLENDSYRVLLYGNNIISGVAEKDDASAFVRIINDIENYCRDHYAKVINKNICKTLVDNVKNRYPGVADGIIPEQISYIELEKKLKEILNEGKSIKDLIHIIEELEENHID